MTFDNEDQIIKLLKLNQQIPDWVVVARKNHKDLKALVYGDDFVDKLLQIEHIESSKRAIARKNYSRPIVDMNERLLRLIDNVYTATGGVKEYKIESETIRKELLKQITNNKDNKSLEKWLQTNWSKDLYIVDPSGVVFLEYKADEEKPNPTYKSIDVIRNYDSDGQKLEWIIFEPKKVKTATGITELVRVVDDEKDYTFKKTGDTFVLVEDLTFEHPFGEVPGLINSNIERIGYKPKLSLIHNVVPLEEELLRDQSILTIFKFQNGFATPIRPVVVCPTCRGTGKDGVNGCTDCGGTKDVDGKGHILRKDVTDEIQIPISLDREEGYNLPTGLFTYMVPPLEIWDQYNKEISKHENLASDTLWGTHKERFENEKTAFETFIDTQPVTIKLSEISEVAEYMEWQLTEWIANFIDPTKAKDERISIISYGKVFIIEPPETIMERYRINKKDGVSTVVLDRQLFEYITSKYKNNPIVLRQELLKKELEYYVHYTVEEVQETFDNKEAQKKILFTDWWETLKYEKIKDKSPELLKEERDTWMGKEIASLNINQNNNQNGE